MSAYLYYPGCSLTGTSREYDAATRALLHALGMDAEQIPQWTCCGATAAAATDEMLSLALPARNLVLAERAAPGSDILVPCSACYLNLRRVQETVLPRPDRLQAVNHLLEGDGLRLEGRFGRVRHLLDVLSRDLSAEALNEAVTRRLEDLVVAPYYGCQCLRPYRVFDDPERPRSMEPLLDAIGVRRHSWRMGATCCGAALMTTHPEAALPLVQGILEAARGADAIVTVCPMCQLNLEAYQSRVSRLGGRDLHTTVLYLPQLMGLALGLTPRQVGLNLNLAVTPGVRAMLEGGKVRR